MGEMTKTVSEQDKLRLALLIITAPQAVEGQELQTVDATLEGAAEKMQMSVAQVAEVLNDKRFLKILKSFSKARANLAINGPVIARIVEIAINGNKRDALQAARILMQYSGDLKERVEGEIKHTHTFDSLRKEFRSAEGEGQRDPLSEIFKIRGVDNVIDAELIAEENTHD